MFSIFQKKKYLIDSIRGITDFHNHLLPGIDDGADNIADSVTMLEKFKDMGIENFIHTPHIIADYYPNTKETIGSAFTNLYSEYKSKVPNRFSAEYMMDQHFVEILDRDEIIPLFESLVLVEMSYFQPPININEIIFKIQNKSLKPILAHPERYAFYHAKDLSMYQNLKSMGCLFQMNMLSLSPHYGGMVQKMAFKLLEENMIDFISSDAHRIEHLDKIEKIALSLKHKDLLDTIIEKQKEKISF